MLFGIDIGGTNIKFGFVDDDGIIVEKHSVATKAHEGRNAVIDRIVSIASELADTAATMNPSAAVNRDTGLPIGICVPGIVDPLSRHVLKPPNLQGWDDVHLGEIVESGTGRRVTATVENDANAAALAEYHLGAGKGHADFLYITLGTGIGGGVILNGRLYTGPHGEAGEIGHTVIDWRASYAGRTPSYRTGVLEELAGNAGIVRRYVDATGRVDVKDVETIAAMAKNGDEAAKKILEETGTIVGLGICSAFAVLGLHRAVVGGGVSKSDVIMNSIVKTVRERAIPTIARDATVVRAHFLDDAGLVGSAMLNRLSLPLHS
ncbi:MAG: ROK family protein [Ignavibacteria bacterium]|nr:ROK family protein [Ignavibacteria bacterium]